MQNDAIDAALAKAGSITTYSGAASAGIGYLTVNELAAVVGALAAVVGLLVQVYYTRQRNRRDQQLHDAQMDAIRRQDERTL